MRPGANLKFVLALLLGVAVHLSEGRTLHASDDTDADVIVIGAGMAGVAAAKNLTNDGKKVILLEARDRTGGRLLSTPIAKHGGRVDTGAMWIHDGAPGNALYDLTERLGLSMSPRMDYTAVSTYTPTAERSNRGTSTRLSLQWATQVLSNITRMRNSGSTKDVLLSQVYTDWLARNSQMSQQEVWQANGLMHSTWQTLLNANITQLSALRYGDAKTLPAVDVLLTNGFDSLVTVLSSGLNIRFNTVVAAIDYSAERVIVSAADGTQYRGKYVILTSSLGVLKKGSISFIPTLPAYKQQAIQNMGMGVLDKTVLVFDEPFWDLNSDFITREAVDWSGRWCVFLSYWRTFGKPVLVALHVADTARSMEQLGDAQVVGEAMQVLRSIYGKNGKKVSDPIQSNVTRWAADPFAYGSYSYFATGNPKNITATLAQPVGRLLFAGEATSHKPATVLGAYLSGLREGQRASDLLAQEAA